MTRPVEVLRETQKQSIFEGVFKGSGIPEHARDVLRGPLSFLKGPNQGKTATFKQIECIILTLLAFFDLVRDFCTAKKWHDHVMTHIRHIQKRGTYVS